MISYFTKYEVEHFKIQDGGRPHSAALQVVFGHNSAADSPISMKFCVGK